MSPYLEREGDKTAVRRTLFPTKNTSSNYQRTRTQRGRALLLPSPVINHVATAVVAWLTSPISPFLSHIFVQSPTHKMGTKTVTRV